MSPTLVPSSFVLLLAVANLVGGFGTAVLLTDSANMHSSGYNCKEQSGCEFLQVSPAYHGEELRGHLGSVFLSQIHL